MSELERKIRDAVKQGKGDAQASARALAAEVERDEKLLRALTKPFLAGILLHAVQRVMAQDVKAAAAILGKDAPPAIAAQAVATARYEKTAQKPPKPGIAMPGDGLPGQKPVPRQRRPRTLPMATLDAVLERWSETIPVAPPPPAPPEPNTPADILKTIGKDPDAQPRPTKAGRRHQVAIHALAQSFGGPKRKA